MAPRLFKKNRRHIQSNPKLSNFDPRPYVCWVTIAHYVSVDLIAWIHAFSSFSC